MCVILYSYVRGFASEGLSSFAHPSCSALTRGTPFVSTATSMQTPMQACLAGADTACDDGSSRPPACPDAQDGRHVGCLITSVPPWQVAYTRLRCCFRCCIQHWSESVGFASNELHWSSSARDRSKASINRDLSEDWKASKLHPHSKGQSMLLSGMGFALLAHANAFQWRSAVEMRLTRENVSTTSQQLLLHSNTAAGVAPMLAYLQTLLLSAERRQQPLPRYVTLISRDDSELPGGPALSQWRSLYKRWPSSRERGGKPRWFLQNSLSLGMASGLHTLPIGVGSANTLSAFLEHQSRGMEAQVAHRTTLLLCCCMQTRSDVEHGEGRGAGGGDVRTSRRQILQILASNGFAQCSASAPMVNKSRLVRLTAHDYYNELLHSKFVVAPSGFGRDTFRFWEALTLGTVPVLRRLPSAASAEMDKYAGLPVVWVDEWDQVTPHLLDGLWKKLTARNVSTPSTNLDVSRAYFPFWLSRLIGWERARQRERHVRPRMRSMEVA